MKHVAHNGTHLIKDDIANTARPLLVFGTQQQNLHDHGKPSAGWRQRKQTQSGTAPHLQACWDSDEDASVQGMDAIIPATKVWDRSYSGGKAGSGCFTRKRKSELGM